MAAGDLPHCFAITLGFGGVLIFRAVFIWALKKSGWGGGWLGERLRVWGPNVRFCFFYPLFEEGWGLCGVVMWIDSGIL